MVKKKDDWFSKLTKAEIEIWKLIYYHPNFTTSRTSALDLMFCVIGTGIEWVNGELKDSQSDNYMNCNKQKFHNIESEIFKKALRNSWSYEKDVGFMDDLNRDSIDWIKVYTGFMNFRAEIILSNIKNLTLTSHIPNYFYPVGKYSNLIEIPNNIKTDWLILAVETYNLIMSCDPKYIHSDMKDINKINQRVIRKIKPKLNRLIKKNGLDIKILDNKVT